MFVNPYRSRVLSLYASILRAARNMPTNNRKNYIRKKARDSFREKMNLSDIKEIEFYCQYAEISLDNVNSQAEHLSKLSQDPRMHYLI